MRYSSAKHPRLPLISVFFSRTFKLWSVRWILAFGVAISFSLIFNHLQLTSQFANYLDGKTRLLQIKKTNDELRQEVAHLEEELADVSNPAWIERQARERGMIRADEQIYQVLEAKPTLQNRGADSFPRTESR